MRAAKVDCIRATRRFGAFVVLTLRTIEKIRAGGMTAFATPRRPACPSRASGWSSLTTPWGFPCCVHSPCVHAAASTPARRSRSLTQTYQPSPKGVSSRPAHRPFQSLLSVHARCGQHTRAVTNSWPAILSHFVASMTAPVASGWSDSPGGPCTHWRVPPSHGAHPKKT